VFGAPLVPEVEAAGVVELGAFASARARLGVSEKATSAPRRKLARRARTEMRRESRMSIRGR